MTLVEAYNAYLNGCDIEVAVSEIFKIGKCSICFTDEFRIGHNVVFPKNGNFNDLHVCDSEKDFWDYYYTPSFKEQWIINMGFIKEGSDCCKYVHSYTSMPRKDRCLNNFFGKYYPENFEYPIFLDDELPFN